MRIFLGVILLVTLSVNSSAILVTGDGSGDTIAPGSSTDQYVPQWNGTDSKTLSGGFPISTQGKTWVNLSSTANMRNNLGIQNHQLLTVTSNGITVLGDVAANTLTMTSLTSQESATLGEELLSSTGWTSSGWTGSFASGWTHTTGNITALSNSLSAISGYFYQISFTVTSRTAGTFDISFGGQSITGLSASGTFGPKATTTGSLTITPTTTFNGKIVISIKQNTGIYNPIITIKDSTATSTISIRSSLKSLGNTFVGNLSGSRNTTGYSNSFYGNSSGQVNTTGYQNIFVGKSSGGVNTTGYQNAFIGTACGEANTTGYENLFIGHGAGSSNTSGFRNICIGTLAGASNTINDNNVYIGRAAGYFINAQYNTYIGSSAGGNTSSGGSNTGIGMLSGYSNTGAGNVFLGYQAARYLSDGSTNKTSGDYGIYLGYNAKASAIGLTNENVLGYNSVGSGSNSFTYGNTSVTKHIFPTGNIGIRTSTPQRVLSVVGDMQVTGNIITTGAMYQPIKTVTGNYTVKLTDDLILCDASTSTVNITLPAVSGKSGLTYRFKKIAGSYPVIIDPNASEQIDGATTLTISALYSAVSIRTNATAWWGF